MVTTFAFFQTSVPTQESIIIHLKKIVWKEKQITLKSG